MGYFIFKAAPSRVLIALRSDLARRSAALGALVASLPLVTVIAMIRLWRDTGDAIRIADPARATFWHVLQSLPMFLAVPARPRSGTGFWPALLAGSVPTVCLYLPMLWIGPRFGLKL